MFRFSALFKGLSWGGVLGALFVFGAHIPADSYRPGDVQAAVHRRLHRVYDRLFPVVKSEVHQLTNHSASNKFFLSPAGQRIGRGVVVLAHYRKQGGRIGYSLWLSGVLREFVHEGEPEGGLRRITRYKNAAERLEVVERLYLGEELLRERFWYRSNGLPPFLLKATLYSREGAYHVSWRDACFLPAPGSALQNLRIAKARELGVRPESLLPFRMGSEVVYLLRSPGRGQRYLHIHPNEQTAVRVLRRHLRSHGGEGFFFLGKGELPVIRRDRYFPYTIGPRKFYFDPNRIFSHIGFRKEFLRVRMFYRYAGYNSPYWYSKYEDQFKKALFYLSQTMVSLFLTRPEPAVIVHDNLFRMGWSESILKGHDSDLAAAYWRGQGQRLTDFFLVTEKRDFHCIKASGHNVILQEAKGHAGDGSASIFFHNLGKRYVCVEFGRDGGFEIGLKMLRLFRRFSEGDYRVR